MPEKPNDIQDLIAASEEQESKSWLITYADMVTLLLTFFVMLLAISNFDTKRFEDIMKSIQFSLGAEASRGGKIGRIDLHDVRRKNLSMPSGKYTEPLMKDVRNTLKTKNLDDSVSVTTEDGKVIIRVKGRTLFPSGSSNFDPKAKEVLDEIAKIVRNYPEYNLHVGGHTDPTPIKTAKFDSNWELSALRATAVLRYLIEQGVDPRRMTATGYADTDPLAPNTSPANMAKNRRVEFVMELRTR